MSGWRVARSLIVLRDEVNAIAPNRSKTSDGTIGDTAHANTPSDHNPNSAGVVCALDLTHDPSAGADMHRISRIIVATRPPALKYVIWNRQIWSVARAAEGWRPYTGSNPHTRHMHVSVGIGPDGRSTGPYDDTSPWGISRGTAIGGVMLPTAGDRGPLVEYWQRILVDTGERLPQYGTDGDFGAETTAAVNASRAKLGWGPVNPGRITAAHAVRLQKIAFGGSGQPGPPGPPGPRGPEGPPGKTPTKIAISGDVIATT